mmetsp:Transcript_11686/g.13318  ORF Transcript_11686/g.13318 Transcript_11686/m.13318 type:complete len:82 (+) Transcript_11686:98-343(+)
MSMVQSVQWVGMFEIGRKAELKDACLQREVKLDKKAVLDNSRLIFVSCISHYRYYHPSLLQKHHLGSFLLLVLPWPFLLRA